MGRDLGPIIGVGSGAAPDAVLPLLKTFLEQARYVVLIDDADEAGLQEALQHLPPSQLRCALLVTSQMLKECDVQRLVCAADCSAVGHKSRVSVCELQPFTVEECAELLQRFCPHPASDGSSNEFPSYAPVHEHAAELRGVYAELGLLPLAVRFFCFWLRGNYQTEMRAARQTAASAGADFDEAATGAAVVKRLFVDWNRTNAGIVL